MPDISMPEKIPDREPEVEPEDGLKKTTEYFRKLRA